MKQKMIAVLCILTGFCLICGSLLLAGTAPFLRSAAASDTSEEGDLSGTVTISREEYETLKQFSELAELLLETDLYFYKETDREKLLQYAAKGLMAGLDDPYSFYYTPEEFAKMWEDDEGKYVGIGVLISADYTTQICTISRVFSDSPAQKAGVQRGDILYRVGDDLYVNADNLQDAVNIMRGLPDTDVEVTFLRKGEEVTFTITREMITVNQIEYSMLDSKVGYIAFYQFAGEAEIEFENALNQLLAEGAEGIMIDLRDNPGGWVNQVQYVGDLFMDEGEVCYLVYRNGEENHAEYRTKDGKTDIPLVILINENSASSSEILSAALKECAGATLVGVKSFGKGIVQGVWNVGTKGAGVQMTVAQYFTPKGNAVHQVGIEPDIVVPLPEGDNGMYEFADLENDVQLQKAYEAMLEKLK